MSRTITVQAGHGCSRPRGHCMAVRCENGCGQYEHTNPAELPAGCLRHDLIRGYVEGGNCGPGLAYQLRNALAAPSKAIRANGEGGTHNKPTSRPPGWNADASELLADIRTHWVAADQATLADWRRIARSILGFAVPSIALPDVWCFVCKQNTLRVAADAKSDVWCANPWCHDDDTFGDCTADRLGYPRELGYALPVDSQGFSQRSCRRTDRSLTHAVRWPRNSWGPIWEQMQAEKAARQLLEEIEAGQVTVATVVAAG